MNKFVINADKDKAETINRTIRFKGETYDTLLALSEEHEITFNKLVNQCVEYALENLAEDDKK